LAQQRGDILRGGLGLEQGVVDEGGERRGVQRSHGLIFPRRTPAAPPLRSCDRFRASVQCGASGARSGLHPAPPASGPSTTTAAPLWPTVPTSRKVPPMRSLEIHGVDDLRVVERAQPEPGPGEVQIAVEWGGICGSDLAYWRHGVSGTATMRHPFVLGHEVSGRVSALGPGVDGFAVGLPVTVHPARTSGPLPERLAGRDNLHPDLTYLGSAARDPHTDGGFAERITVRAEQVVPLPDGLDTRRAVLAEPLGVAIHAVHRAGD